jgi:hypothetical protein
MSVGRGQVCLALFPLLPLHSPTWAHIKNSRISLETDPKKKLGFTISLYDYLLAFMPDHGLSSQALDLTFHPKEDVVYTTLLNGEINCYNYDDEGQITPRWNCRPTKKSGRAIDISPNGDCLWAGNKNGTV